MLALPAGAVRVGASRAAQAGSLPDQQRQLLHPLITADSARVGDRADDASSRLDRAAERAARRRRSSRDRTWSATVARTARPGLPRCGAAGADVGRHGAASSATNRPSPRPCSSPATSAWCATASTRRQRRAGARSCRSGEPAGRRRDTPPMARNDQLPWCRSRSRRGRACPDSPTRRRRGRAHRSSVAAVAAGPV